MWVKCAPGSSALAWRQTTTQNGVTTVAKPNSALRAFRDLAHSRRSVRDFLPAPIAEEVLTELIEDALTAPSWSNTRPYRFAIATGDTRDRISRALLERADDLLQIRSSRLRRRLRGMVKAPGLLVSDFRIPVVYPKDLRARQGLVDDPLEQVRVWIHYSLAHLASEEHVAIRKISMDALPEDLRGVLRAMHGYVMLSLMNPLDELGVGDPSALCGMIFGSISAAAKRVEEGASMTLEAKALEVFVVSGIQSSVSTASA